MYISGQKELVATGYEAITVSNAVKTITAGLITPVAGSYTGKSAIQAIISVETDQIRFRLDGGNPTDAVGHLLDIGDYFIVDGPTAIANLKMIRVTTDASVKVTVFHGGSRIS